MNAVTKMSSKGQVVIPKDVRDRYRLLPGAELDVIETEDGFLMRPRQKKSGRSFDELIAEFRKLYTHTGPPVSIEEMNLATDRMFEESWKDDA